MKMNLPADLSAPSIARNFVSDRLDLLDDPDNPWSLEDVVLVVSELVTNSVRAGAKTISVRLQLSDDRLQLQVADDADGVPTPREAQPHDVRGRGLAITEALADEWGVSEEHPLKVVTATWQSDGR